MSHPKKLWCALIRTTPALAEAFAASLGDDALALTILAPPRKAEARIEAIYDAAPGRAALTARLAVAAALHRAKPPKILIREMPQLDWLAKVAGDFPPLPVARWIVHGSQHGKTVLLPRHALQIDATNAFGTGEHPTTRGCLLMLDWLLRRRPSMNNRRYGYGRIPSPLQEGNPDASMGPNIKSCMLDLGCGSGILAMAYANATRRHAIATDLDPESVRVAKDNVRVNGLQNHIRVSPGNGYRAALIRQNAPYDLITSNIFAGPLCRMARDLKGHLRPGGTAILSGILNHQANRVLAAHRLQGLHLARRLNIGEWSVLALRRPARAKWRR